MLPPHMQKHWAQAGCKIMHEIVIGWLVCASAQYERLDDSARQIVDAICQSTMGSVEVILRRYREVQMTLLTLNSSTSAFVHDGDSGAGTEAVSSNQKPVAPQYGMLSRGFEWVEEKRMVAAEYTKMPPSQRQATSGRIYWCCNSDLRMDRSSFI